MSKPISTSTDIDDLKRGTERYASQPEMPRRPSSPDIAALKRGTERYGNDRGEYGKLPELESFDGPRVATVGIISGDEILTGKRRDNGLWTGPGGHMEKNERPDEAGVREVYEETGIIIHTSDLKPIGAKKLSSHRGGKDFVIFCFLCSINKEQATVKNDPDKEVSEWRWVKISPDTAELQPCARHAKEDLIIEYLMKNRGTNG